ncbi:hypothetical protein PR048_023423 [Dryococelus australis]|uniref:Uncharacterized protein n=1 Tax=Dryococelus australis TaxID=614101 RepID=A0ABQ9GU48_9NEOP|nr:hypothetical protein PR048_023423 [Dryococelus australis]
MPPKYERKMMRQSWPQQNMQNAVTEVIEGRLRYLKASKCYQVPQTTLEIKVKKSMKERQWRKLAKNKSLAQNIICMSFKWNRVRAVARKKEKGACKSDLYAYFFMSLGRFKPVFNKAQQKKVVEHILLMGNSSFGVLLKDLRRLAFELANKNNLSNNFNQDTKLAGKA